jgi:hypothetical protein
VTYTPPGRSSKMPFKSRWLKEDLNYLSLHLLVFIIFIDKRKFSYSRPRSAAIHWAIYTESLLTNNAVGKFSYVDCSIRKRDLYWDNCVLVITGHAVLSVFSISGCLRSRPII